MNHIPPATSHITLHRLGYLWYKTEQVTLPESRKVAGRKFYMYNHNNPSIIPASNCEWVTPKVLLVKTKAQLKREAES